MFCFVILCIIMAGFEFDDEYFSLSGLTQEGHDSVTVINSSSSSDDENYHGLMECACQLAGETSNKVSMEGGMQPGVEQPGVEPGVKPGVNFPISKMSDSGLFLSNDMASSLSQSEQSNDVSFSHQICLQSLVKIVVFARFFHHMLLLRCVTVIGLHLIKLISCLHIYSRSWLMAQFWQMRLSLNVILGPFRCECSVPSWQNK